jgi:hypothetical protein
MGRLWLPAKRKKTPIRRQLSQQWVAPLIFTVNLLCSIPSFSSARCSLESEAPSPNKEGSKNQSNSEKLSVFTA